MSDEEKRQALRLLRDEEMRQALRLLLDVWEAGGQEAVEALINLKPTTKGG